MTLRAQGVISRRVSFHRGELNSVNADVLLFDVCGTVFDWRQSVIAPDRDQLLNCCECMRPWPEARAGLVRPKDRESTVPDASFTDLADRLGA